MPLPASSNPRLLLLCFSLALLFLFSDSTPINHGFLLSNRKLVRHHVMGIKEPERMAGDDKCSKSDIVINQGATEPQANGIPTYTVEITNVCVTGCDISHIHLNCGWFSSARLINPNIFKRLGYNDCFANNGRPLVNGGTLSFQYANTFLYPLSVSSLFCPGSKTP